MRQNLWDVFRPSPAYVLALALFLVHQLVQKLLGLKLPFVDGYLDPFLSIPLLLGLAWAEQRWLLGRRADEPFTAVEVTAMTVALAVLFEEGFPRIDPARQTRDVWDYVAYGMGAVVYYWSVRRGRRRSTASGQCRYWPSGNAIGATAWRQSNGAP